MHFTSVRHKLQFLRKRATALRECVWRGIPLVVLVGVFVWSVTEEAQAASSWNPTLLVNTESFQIIDDGDGTTDIELQFGYNNEKLLWKINESRFQFTSDMLVGGDLTATGSITASGAITTEDNITLNKDNAAQDAVITFGNDSGAETITFKDGAGNEEFQVSDDLHVDDNLSASGTISADGSISTDANLTINADDGNVDAVLTFGNDSGAKALTYSNANTRFEFADDVHVTGTLETTSDVTVGGTITIGGVTYTFPGADGSDNFALTTDGGGNLTWENPATSMQGVFDDRYVNTSGDTMTGALSVQANISGATLRVDDNADIWGTLSVSGVTAFDGASTFGSTIDAVGSITTDANLTINEDDGAADAVLTFGNDSGAETITFKDGAGYEEFQISDDLHVDDNLTASGTLSIEGAAAFGSTIEFNDVTYTFPYGDGAASGRVLKTDSAGQLTWAADTDTNTNAETECDPGEYLDGNGDCADVIEEAEMDDFSELQTQIADAIVLSQTTADNRYVNTSGDTMTGNLVIQGADLIASGATITSNLAASGTISAEGNISTDGNLSGSTLTVDGDVTLHGVQYSFPTDNGDNGEVLTTDGGGNLTWDTSTVGTGSGGVLFLSPEYPHAVYFSSGSVSNYIGQMSYDYDETDNENFYHWATTKTALQEYWISARVRVPDNFSVWDANEPIEFRYRTGTSNSADNYLIMRLYDTTGTEIALTSGDDLKNTSWTTATITGPEGGGTYTKSEYITIAIKMVAKSTGSADAGFINLNWETTAP